MVFSCTLCSPVKYIFNKYVFFNFILLGIIINNKRVNKHLPFLKNRFCLTSHKIKASFSLQKNSQQLTIFSNIIACSHTATTAKTTTTKAAATKTTTTAKAVKPAATKTAAKPAAEKKVAKPVATGKIRVTMVHGLASCTKRQIRTAKALKLSRPGDTRELPNLPSTLGACKKLEHLVKVEII